MKHDVAIKSLSHALRDEFGDELGRILVFGSAATGQASEVSDVDVIVILDRPSGTVDWQDERRVRFLAYPIELTEDVVFDLKVRASADLRGIKGHTPFMERILSEGIPV